MGSPSHSHTSLHPASPIQPSAPPNANRLVNHLVVAKRALSSSTGNVVRGKEIVAHAQDCIEQIAILNANNSFLEQRVTRNLKLARRVRTGLHRLRQNAQDDFNDIISKLDDVSGGLNDMKELLKTTVVEESLTALRVLPEAVDQDVTTQSDAGPSDASEPTTSAPSGDEAAGQTKRPSDTATSPDPPQKPGSVGRSDEETETPVTTSTGPRCLYDFVKEQGVDDVIISVIQQLIRVTQEAHFEFDLSNHAFDEQLKAIASLLSPAPTSQVSSDEANATTVSFFETLEEHARDTAENLNSLAQHYELCVTAIKHTEGAGQAAAEKNVSLEDSRQRLDAPSASLHAPISHEERMEMLQVLENDAAEVEAVVQEMADHVAGMESRMRVIDEHLDRSRAAGSRLAQAIRLLEELGGKLPAYIAAGTKCTQVWTEQKELIQDRMERLDEVQKFYADYLDAYDHMILEIARRTTARLRMDKVAAEAVAKIKKMREEDAGERRFFFEEYGDYIPQDLWPGVFNAPATYQVSANHAEDAIPAISQAVTQRVMERRTRPK